MKWFNELQHKHRQGKGVFQFLRFIGPGILVTVGFIDPGNWATNIDAGSSYGYQLLWVVTLSTIMLILLQHNAAHLGIVTGKCLSESATLHLKPYYSRPILTTAMLAAISTAFAELLGGAIALQILFNLPISIGALLILLATIFFTFSNAYSRIEKIIISFVSIIGFSFLFELLLINTEWDIAVRDAFVPSIPHGALFVILGVLGSVVMPHNLYLHSEVIQSRQWNLQNKDVIKKQLKYEFLDTLLSMGIGWLINSAMIVLAAAVFFANNTPVSDIAEASKILTPFLGKFATIIFALAFLFAGISSSITAAMSGGIIFAGIFSEAYNIKDIHSKAGALITLLPATLIIFFVSNAFHALVFSQVILSFQLPITVLLLVYLTSSTKVMGEYANKGFTKTLLWSTAILVTILNIWLLIETFMGKNN